jgi:hypothetical protein
MIPREELQTLYESLAYASALKLRRAVQLRERARAARRPRPADYEPWSISLKDARAFVAKQGQRQILAKPQPFDGKIVADLEDERWAADLIQYTSQPAQVGEKRFQYVLVAQDIFTRYVWTRTLVTAKAAEVRDAFKDIVQKSGRKPRELNTPQAQGAQHGQGERSRKQGVSRLPRDAVDRAPRQGRGERHRHRRRRDRHAP